MKGKTPLKDVHEEKWCWLFLENKKLAREYYRMNLMSGVVVNFKHKRQLYYYFKSIKRINNRVSFLTTTDQITTLATHYINLCDQDTTNTPSNKFMQNSLLELGELVFSDNFKLSRSTQNSLNALMVDL